MEDTLRENKMLKKHDLTIDDINQDIPKNRFYPYTTNLKRKLIVQIVAKVATNPACYGVRGYREVSAKVNDYEHIQILELIDFHFDNFENERKRFLNDFTSAYIQKHRLFIERDEDFYDNQKPLTQKEKEAIWRMSAIKDCLSNNSYTKKLQ